MTSDSANLAGDGLAPLRVRLIVFAALVAITVVSIWFIDRRAMEIQARHGWSPGGTGKVHLQQP